MAESTEEVLRRLEERLAAASGAAERLFSEAAAQATSAALRSDRPKRATQQPRDSETATGEAPPGPSGTPPQGWQTPKDSDAPRSPGDLELIITALEAVADLIPPDLRRRLAEAVREVLLAVRALIDWYLERSEARAQEPPEVQDIPSV